MRYPCLVPARLCKIPVEVRLYSEELSEDGAPNLAIIYNGKCNYQDNNGKRVLTKEQQTIIATGTALFPGDTFPTVPVIHSGTILIFGMERNIVSGSKERNPDGSVNYTRLYIE